MTRKFTASVIVAALLALALSAQAQIIPSTTVTYNGNPYPSDQLSITYEVTETGGLYTYSYILSTSPAVDLTSFTIGGVPDPIDTQGAVILSGGDASSITSDSIVYEWAINPGTTSDDVSYTSPLAPTYGSFTFNGDGVDWNSPALIPVPAAVPEASNLLAGALMILPFGVGICRSLRKERRL